MRAPDRGGGRENKKGSLRKSKVNRVDAIKSALNKPREERPETAPPPPPIAPLPPLPPRRAAAAGPFVDGFANLISRQFDRDREAVLRRAREGGVSAIVVASADADKQEEVVALARAFPGALYACVGALPDNIKRTNEKQAAAWVAAVRELCLSTPEVVAVQSGLNLSREASTHHAQEKLFEAHARLTAQVGLPLIVHAPPGDDGASLARCLELLEGAGAGGAAPLRFALHDAALHLTRDAADVAQDGDDPLAAWRAAGGYLLLTGALISQPDAPGAAAAASALGLLAASPDASPRLLLASGAPQHTPQTLADAYLRTLRNEPSNLPSVAADVAAAAARAGGAAAPDAEALTARMWDNALRFYGLSPAADAGAAAADVGAAAAAGAAAAVAPAAAAASPAAGARRAGGSPAKAAPAAAGGDSSSSDDDDDEEAPPVRASAPQRRRGGQSAFAQLAAEDDDASGASSSASASADASSSSSGDDDDDDDAEGRYACRKCRARLFSCRAAFAGAASASAADDNLCLSAVFVPIADGGVQCLEPLGLAIADDAADDAADGGGVGTLKVVCARCRAKLGRYAAAAQPCACGALVAGPAVKLAASRLDFVDGHNAAAGGIEALRLRGERDGAAGGAAGDEADAAAAAAAAKAAAKKRRDAKKGVKKESKGNFSNYRNKTT
jgi:hypothetical protein